MGFDGLFSNTLRWFAVRLAVYLGAALAAPAIVLLGVWLGTIFSPYH